MHFTVWFKTKSWQSILAADMHAAIKRGIERSREERRITLIDCEAALDHMLLSIGARRDDQLSTMRHLITGASARFSLRAAPDIRLSAGVSNFWQKRPERSLNLSRPSPITLGGGPEAEHQTGEQRSPTTRVDASRWDAGG